MDPQWITTQSGNTISKSATIRDPQQVLISGHSTIQHHVSLNSSSLQLGKFVYIDTHSTIGGGEGSSSSKCKIGSYVIVQPRCKLQCSNIGNRVCIGSGCTLSKGVIIHDCVVVESNTVIGEAVNIPPFSLVRQDCAVDHEHVAMCGIHVEVLNESFKKLIEQWSKWCYINHEIPSEIP
jgi:bifunctional N-acetylglucosamine-1-phosphate-uridyltransferase/glucosamine-1-phosphate-acetyltransferase GlmU-like protein